MKKLEYVHNIISQSRSNKEEYATEYALVIARTIDQYNTKGNSLAQTFSLKQGMKKYGQKGYQAAHKEMNQLHKRECFRPIDILTMTTEDHQVRVQFQ